MTIVTIMTKTEALDTALGALRVQEFNTGYDIYTQAIAVLKALAQTDECPNLKHCQGACFVCEYWNSETGEMEYPAQSEQTEQSEQSEQEPVAYIGMISNDHFIDVCNKSQGNSNTALYSYAPKRKWVSLTNDDIFEAIKGMCSSVKVTQALIEIGTDEYMAIEAKVKELNYDKY